MKIICVGRNYAGHAKELGNAVPTTEPVIFLKPDTALLRNNDPFYYPDFSQDVHHELELVFRISREGKNIDEKFAPKYVDQIGLGIDFTARDLQARLKKEGLPWELAKGFDRSAAVGTLLPASELSDWANIHFTLEVNGQLRQQGHSADMIFSPAQLISFVSRYFTLKTGDLIFTGTPAGVSGVQIGDRIVGKLEGQVLLDFEIR